jgi:hypothetical protein
VEESIVLHLNEEDFGFFAAASTGDAGSLGDASFLLPEDEEEEEAEGVEGVAGVVGVAGEEEVAGVEEASELLALILILKEDLGLSDVPVDSPFLTFLLPDLLGGALSASLADEGLDFNWGSVRLRDRVGEDFTLDNAGD